MKAHREDISGRIGNLFPDAKPAEYTMYSFDRPAYNFWQGFYDGLLDRGLTHDQAINEMQSKGVRWMFDGEATDQVKELGRKLAKTYQPYCQS